MKTIMVLFSMFFTSMVFAYGDSTSYMFYTLCENPNASLQKLCLPTVGSEQYVESEFFKGQPHVNLGKNSAVSKSLGSGCPAHYSGDFFKTFDDCKVYVEKTSEVRLSEGPFDKYNCIEGSGLYMCRAHSMVKGSDKPIKAFQSETYKSKDAAMADAWDRCRSLSQMSETCIVSDSW